MLNLDAERQAQEPWWFTVQAAVGDMPAVEVRFIPIGRAALRRARRAAAEAIGAELLDTDDDTLPIELVELAGDVLSESLLMSGIDAWRGVGDKAGEPVAVTPDNLALFLAAPTRFERLDEAYVRPFVMRELEKNGLAASPNGISGIAAPNIAEASVKPRAKGVAKRTRPKAGNAAAPTQRTSRKRTRGSVSGTS